MKPVGIVANPASGKDIRRLIANGTVISNAEKINIIVRALAAMDALQVPRVLIMPDPSHIGQRVIEKTKSKLKHTQVELLELPYLLGTQMDTRRSVARMRELDCACIIVMGGDGTSRVASTESGDVPLVPVSTGTNNVFPQMIEGTLVGLATAALTTGAVSESEACTREPKLELLEDGELKDIALVDLAVVSAIDSAAKAVWEAESLRELFLTRYRPATIGLSAIGGSLPLSDVDPDKGLHVVLGEGGRSVNAAMAPGLMRTLLVKDCRQFDESDEFDIQHSPAMVALDGEREVAVNPDHRVTVRMNRNGPRVLQITKTLELATARGFFLSEPDKN